MMDSFSFTSRLPGGHRAQVLAFPLASPVVAVKRDGRLVAGRRCLGFEPLCLGHDRAEARVEQESTRKAPLVAALLLEFQMLIFWVLHHLLRSNREGMFVCVRVRV